MAASSLLFVYGSLKRGFAHHELMAAACFLRETETERGYCLVILGDYAALAETGDGSVSGELYRVSGEHLARLDEFEGADYSRRAVRLRGEDAAEAYFANVSALGLVRYPGKSWDRR